MSKTDLTIAISGCIDDHRSPDMRSFWGTFIELQQKLPNSIKIKKIVTHSWNPEHEDLVRLAYDPSAQRDESQELAVAEILRKVKSPDLLENFSEDPNSIKEKIEIQAILKNAISRSKVIEILDGLNISQGQVLMINWDMGKVESSQVCPIVADSALPPEYLYFSYSNDVEKGYYNKWVIGPIDIIKQFRDFDEFVVDSLSGKNDYIQRFCETGWPKSRKMTPYETLIYHSRFRTFGNIVLKILSPIEEKSRTANYKILRVVNRIILKIKHFFNPTLLTAENSYFRKVNSFGRTFPRSEALHLDSLTKYFVLKNGLREKTRFLSKCDFNIENQSGQLINPQHCILVLWSMSGDENECFRNLINSSPLPFFAVAHLGDKVRVWTRGVNGEWVSNTSCSQADSKGDKLFYILKFLKGIINKSIPIMFVPSDKNYLRCSDWFYLNALLKYTTFRHLAYISLDVFRHGIPSLDFPDVYISRGAGAFSLKTCLGSVDGLLEILSSPDVDIEDFSGKINKMKIEFPVVNRSIPLFS